MFDDDSSVEIFFVVFGVMVKVVEIEIVFVVVCLVGLNILLGCIFGVCGICKVKKNVGEVYMVYNGGILEDDFEVGYILVCCFNLIGKVEVEV